MYNNIVFKESCDILITMKNIIVEGHPTLKKIGKEIKIPLSQSDKRLAKDLLDFIKNSQDSMLREKYNLKEAVGIAAPQINISKKMFALHFDDFQGDSYSFVVINPKIISKSSNIIYLPDGEGCLSVIREAEGVTPRYEEISARFLKYDPYNDLLEKVQTTLKNYPAIVFQHEYDHINGILFTDKLFENYKDGKSVFLNYPELEFQSNSDDATS